MLGRSRSPRGTFARKAMGGLVLLGLAQWLFYSEWIGATLGIFVLAWCATLMLVVPAMRRGTPAAWLGIAALLSLMLVEAPNTLGLALCWMAIAGAALMVRQRFDDAFRCGARVLALAAAGPFGLVRDAVQVRRRSRGKGRLQSLLRVLALPLGGGAAFLALFSIANPVLSKTLGGVELPSFFDILLHLLFWFAVLAAIWPAFRPRVLTLAPPSTERVPLPGLSAPTLLLSLASFNAVFALQNGLDLAFLWSGAPLPTGVTLADYAHRGAYTLIATTLLAGAFVLVALVPGSEAAQSPGVRRLLVVWVAQNLLLVASSAMRLGDYVVAYSLTELRIAAFAWMGLVATGLVLICWRLLAGRSAAWLINTNALATLVVLVAANLTDLGTVAARWNVDQAREGERLDLCYLDRLGASALLPLADLERRAGGPILSDRVRYLRRKAQADLTSAQGDWHSWTWRGARRLAAVQAIVGNDAVPVRAAPAGRFCGGGIIPHYGSPERPRSRFPLTTEAAR